MPTISHDASGGEHQAEALGGLVSTLGAFLWDSLIGEIQDLQGGLSGLFRTPWPPEKVLSWAPQVSDTMGSGSGVGGAGGRTQV